jgi:uroporphyrinogen-III synthase
MSKPANRLARPLAKTRILVGRASHQASALSTQLRSHGATVIEIPFIEIRKPKSFQPLDSALKNIAAYDWLILTSVNGVEALMQRMSKLHLDKRSLKDLRVAAIGPATKKAIEQSGIKVDVVPRQYIAESVVRSLRRRIAGKRVLLVRAKVARDVIPRELRLAGAEVNVVEAYQTVVPAASRARLRNVLRNPSHRPHLATFTSSSTVRNFVNLVGTSKAQLRGIRFASIGPVTSTTLRELGMNTDIQASEFTIPGLVKALVTAAILLRD